MKCACGSENTQILEWLPQHVAYICNHCGRGWLVPKSANLYMNERLYPSNECRNMGNKEK